MRIQINILNANKYEIKESYELSKNFNTLGDVEAKKVKGCGQNGSWQMVMHTSPEYKKLGVYLDSYLRLQVDRYVHRD